MERGLVSCEWLAQRLATRLARPFAVLDATWFLPNSPFACPVPDGSAEGLFRKGPRIPGAQFFDIDAVSDHSSGLPHMLPQPRTLASALAKLGVSKQHEVVVYDQLGIFSAPRLWYTLKAFGHPSVAVLDGGLPKWLTQERQVEEGEPAPATPTQEEEWELNRDMVWDVKRVVANVVRPEATVLDARGAGRFMGTVPEPRPGMRSGHIPGSLNVPFTDLLEPDKTMKSPESLAEIFTAAGLKLPGSPEELPHVVTSCGSGITACVVGLGLRQAGFPVESRWAVYDGSWSEYGARSDTPVATTGPDGKEELLPQVSKM